MVSFPSIKPVDPSDANAVKDMAIALMNMAAAESQGDFVVAKLHEARDQLTMALAAAKGYAAAKQTGHDKLAKSAKAGVLGHLMNCSTIVLAVVNDIQQANPEGSSPPLPEPEQ